MLVERLQQARKLDWLACVPGPEFAWFVPLHSPASVDVTAAILLRKSPGLYARSLKLQGKAGEVKPEEIYVALPEKL